MSDAKSIFQILDDPEAVLKELKGDLAAAIVRRIRDGGLSQQAAAAAMGLARSEVSRIMNGRFSRFTIDRLVTALLAIDPDAKVTVLISDRLRMNTGPSPATP